MTKGIVVIDQDRCKGCGICAAACPQNVIEMDSEILNRIGYHPAVLVDSENGCTGCAVCAVMCPDVCITVYREPAPRRAAVR